MRSLQLKWSKCRNVAAVLTTLTCLVGADSALAQATPPATTAARFVEETEKAPEIIELTVGQSRFIVAPWPVKRVAVGDPAIADVDAASPTRVQLKGKSVGISEVTLFNEQGESWQAKLEVKADLSRLQRQLRTLFANDSLQVVQIDEVIAIKGTLAQSEDVAQLRQLLSLSKVPYLDMTTVAGLQQVQLQVKIAEVSRTVVRALSTDWAFSDGIASLAVNNAASSTFRPTTPIGNFTRALPGGTTIFGSGMVGSTTFEYFVQALADNQYLRILAEPTLVTRSGQEARFLVGGEFPIPIANQSGASTQISIAYKQFGVQLQFTPTVLGNGKISLKLQPEISQLSDVGAVVVFGTRVPSVLSRRVDTTLDLQSGQTFAIAGLINQTDTAKASKLPGIGELPVLGALFRSVRYQRDDTEMVVLVTASLVEPSSNELDPTLPGDLHTIPNDWELYVDGRLEGKARTRVAPAQKERLQGLGLDRLRGPGAWASYDDRPRTLAADTGAGK